MKWHDYKELVKQDIKRSSGAFKDLGYTYRFRLLAIFILNVLGIAGFVIFKEKFPLPVFLVILGISAFILIDILWNICRKNIRENFPNSFATEVKKYGEPQHCFKCWMVYVGSLRFQGFRCKMYVYANALLIKYGKSCLIIDDKSQINIFSAFFGYYCEFRKDEKYVRCFLNGKQAEIIKVLSKKS